MGLGTNRDRGAEIAYEAIAPAYDDFTAHHKYEALMEELLPALEQHGLAGHRLLDVGCGTGKSFLPMLSRGWAVTACDVSPAMVARAREKVGDSVRLEVADMRDLPVFGEFDLVWPLVDAVNYLLDRDELKAALAGMRDNLAASGVLLFDVSTLLAYRSFFATSEVIEQDGARLVRRGFTSADAPSGSVWEARFAVEGGAKMIEPHLHRQRHFPELDMLEALRASGLEVLDVAGQHVDGIGLQRPLNESEHTKAVYIARRSGAD
ncbi:MAG TPA: class I SAM-dependent methyltransferase [Solirubrobacterales bacterium]